MANSGGSDSLVVTVSDPMKQGEGMSSYTSYRVNTVTNRTDFNSGNCSVTRRFKDFIWLHSKLVEAHVGVIVPAMPEKNMVSRFNSEFVETRRRSLEKFMLRVASHQELSHSVHFRNFLQNEQFTSDAIGQEAGDSTQPATTTSTGGGWMSWIDDTVSSIQTMSTSLTSNVDSKSFPSDATFFETIEYLKGLEETITALALSATEFVKSSRELADATFHFGTSLGHVSQAESGSLSTATLAMSKAIDEISIRTTALADAELIQFEEPIHEYVRIITAVRLAISKRNEVKAQYISSSVTVETRKAGLVRAQQAAAAAASSGSGKKDDRLAIAEDALSKAEEIEGQMREMFNTVSEKLAAEIELFKYQEARDMKYILGEFASLQTAHQEFVESTWAGLLPVIEGIQVSTMVSSKGGSESKGDDVSAAV